MSYEDAKKFLDEVLLDPILKNKYLLAWTIDAVMSLADHYGLSFTMEELDAASYENTKDWQVANIKKEPEPEPPKLVADIDYIFRDHEKLFKKQFDEWLEKIRSYSKEEWEQKKSELYDIEFEGYTGESPLLRMLRTKLAFISKSAVKTRCKAEDFLDPLYIKSPNYFWPIISYLPSKANRPCKPQLLVWCFDEDDLGQRIQEMVDYVNKCPQPIRSVIFLTTHWDWKAISPYKEKLKSLFKSGAYLAFIFFSMQGAVEL